GRQLLAELLRSEDAALPGVVTLGALWHRYRSECPAYLDNKPETQRDDGARAKLLLAFFGERCDVRTLAAKDQAAYTTRRRAGGIVLGEKKRSRPVRARSVEMELVLLHAMLSWASTVRQPNGARLLDFNPLAGVRREREKNPKRPIASWERFQLTRTAMKDLRQAAAKDLAENPKSVMADFERARWAKMELALMLAEATGRRLGAIRQLRWDDVDFERKAITWRAESDKKGTQWIVPIPDSLVEELKRFRQD